MYSPIPSFNNTNVRLALPSDLKRMGSVTIAGCHPSQSFAWNQPYYSSHPIDALRSSRLMYKNTMMKEMDRILLVIEDTYDPNEASYCPDIITSEANEPLPQPGDKVVVGVAIFQLPKNSPRLGQFQNTRAIEVDLPLNETTNDTDLWHYLEYAKKTASVMTRHFETAIYLSTLTVHPAYSRRGHGASLTRWGLDLARMDGVNVRLVALEFGNWLYKRLGFEVVEGFVVMGDEVSPVGVEGEVLRWRFGKDKKEDKVVKEVKEVVVDQFCIVCAMRHLKL